MRFNKALLICGFFVATISSMFGFSGPELFVSKSHFEIATDTIPVTDRDGDFITDPNNNPFDITPSIIDQQVEYDPASGQYIIIERIGDEYYRNPSYMTFEEYMAYRSKQDEQRYFNRLAGISTGKKGDGKIFTDPMDRIDIQRNLVDRLFGGTEVNIQPQGNVDVSLGFDYTKREDPSLGPRQQNRFYFPDFDMDIRMNVDGSIGEKLNLGFNYDTQSTFDFDRKIKLEYDTEAFSEDDIIKKIEAGNVSLPLRSNLIQGAQSLFGLKTELQFGHLRITALASQQRSEQNNLQIENGASKQEFEIYPDEYDENRHFFLSHYHRENFEENLQNLPFIPTSMRILDVNVFISEDRPDYQQNSFLIAAIADIGESDEDKFTNIGAMAYQTQMPIPSFLRTNSNEILPDNRVNTLFEQLQEQDTIKELDKTASLLSSMFQLRQIRDFEIFRGRKLNASEFTYNEKLGFISLNVRLRPNQKMGVSYTYKFTQKCDTLFSVGQIPNQSLQSTERQTVGEEPEAQNVMYVKMLKSSNQSVNQSLWDLMMKNVYSLRTAQLNPDDFQFDIFFEDDRDGSIKKFLPEPGFDTEPLLNFFNLDNLNQYSDPQPDGVFDFVPGITVIPRNGSIIFPVLEPFGSSLDTLFGPGNETLANRYKYQQLYDSTITVARETLERNKFVMKGEVSSATSGEIFLGPFTEAESVRVTVGGRLLVLNQDYELDPSLGRLRIINEAYLQEGLPINVSFEDNASFSLQQKTMLGLRADYEVSKNLSIGATYLRLFERPFTEKVNIGDDPINNRVFGLDMNYSNEVDWLTKTVDKLPFYSTKEKSTINFSAEVAALKPGHSGAINLSANDQEDGGGVVNIDDFEGAVSGFLLGGFNVNAWTLASTPSDARFPEADSTSLEYGMNRALINWYQLDRGTRSAEDQTDPYTRLIDQTQLFQRQTQTGLSDLSTFDISYYPNERGPYNYERPEGSNVSDGLEWDSDSMQVRLRNPETRWGGLQRNFNNTDFEASNYGFIEFWMLNPYMERRDGLEHDNTEEGELVFHLGNVSEDILRDNLQFYENALPVTQGSVSLKQTSFGQVPLAIPIVNGFDISKSGLQDVGLDGLNDAEEQLKFQDYITEVTSTVGLDQRLLDDPANDNFEFYGNISGNNLIPKYKQFNNPEGNYPDNTNNSGSSFVRGNRLPDSEDLNNNKSLDQGESFYEYKIYIKPTAGGDELDTTASNKYWRETKRVSVPGGKDELWYRFQIPLDQYDRSNGITGFRSIQFMKMYLANFKSAKIFRLAEFELVRNIWRKYDKSCGIDGGIPTLNVDDVGVEENSSRLPFNYVTPQGIKQERITSTFSNLLQDEKSMSLDFCDLLQDSCEVSIYKLARLDLTLYKRLQMFVHAEESRNSSLEDDDLYAFIRIGKDFQNNYYEYRLPLKLSDPTGAPNDESNVWPDENFINISLDSFKLLKRLRIERSFPLIDPFRPDEFVDSKGGRFSMKGNPSLGQAKVVQIGVVKGNNNINNHCGIVWFNELRAAGLDESGGFAGQAQLQMQMADLGEINLAGSYSSVGWGALDQKLQERNQEELINYDIATNLQLGKLLPKGLGLNIPFYGQYSKSISNPRFDPFEKDISLDERLESLQKAGVTQDSLDEVKNQAQDVTTIKTFNFTNVKHQSEGKGAKKPWSIDNVSASYAFTETKITNPLIKEDITKNYQGTIDYNYNRKAGFIKPLKFIKSKYLKLFSEFNFNPLPHRLKFSTSLQKETGTRTFRLPETPVYRFDQKRFAWNRRYGLDWDFTKSLKFSFNAEMEAIVDELRQIGIKTDPKDREWVNELGETVEVPVDDPNPTVNSYRNDNLKKLGRNKNYTHEFSLKYTVPFKYIPLMDWINASADYRSDYAWIAGPLIFIDEFENRPGNIIQNGQTRSATATFNFDKLYSKSGYLKSIERSKRSSARSRRSSRTVEKKDEKKDDKKDDKKRNSNKDDGPSTMEKILIRPLLMLRNIKLTYRQQLSTLIPGFTPESEYLGLSEGFNAPGWGFVGGLQPDLETYLDDAAGKRWINDSYNFNEIIEQSSNYSFDAKVGLEPFKDFKVDITMNKDFRETHTEQFKNKNITGDPDFLHLAKYDIGSFEVSYFALNTLFDDLDQLYSTFKSNRPIVSQRLAPTSVPHEQYGDSGYLEGYGPTNTEVTIPAFLAAYTGKDILNSELDLKSSVENSSFIPKPNWKLNYDGLGKLNIFKDVFSNISFSHGYKSSLSVNRFETNEFYDNNNVTTINDDTKDYFTRFDIPSVSISEQFVPIIGIKLKTKNDINLDFEYRKTRQLDLQLRELLVTNSSELRFGFGYTIKNFGGFGGGKKKKRRAKKDEEKTAEEDKNKKDPSRDRGRGRVSSSRGKTLTMNLDFSLRDDIREVYPFLEDTDPAVDRGSNQLSINPNVEYEMNKNLTLRFFVDYTRQKPYSTISFPTTNLAGGVTVKFILN